MAQPVESELIVKTSDLTDELKFQEDAALYPYYVEADQTKKFPLTLIHAGSNAYRGKDVVKYTMNGKPGGKPFTRQRNRSVGVIRDPLTGVPMHKLGDPRRSLSRDEQKKLGGDPRHVSLEFSSCTQRPFVTVRVMLEDRMAVDGGRDTTRSAIFHYYADNFVVTNDDIGIDFAFGEEHLSENNRVSYLKEKELSNLAQNGTAWITSLKLREEIGPRVTGVELDELITYTGQDERWLFARELLSAKSVDFVTELYTSSQEYAKEFARWMRTVCYVCAHEGMFWYYKFAAKGTPLSSPQFPFATIEPPRWLVTEWLVTTRGSVQVSKRPYRCVQFPEVPQPFLPDESTYAFEMRLAEARESSAPNSWSCLDREDGKSAISIIQLEGGNVVPNGGIDLPAFTLGAPRATNHKSDWLERVFYDGAVKKKFEQAIAVYHLDEAQKQYALAFMQPSDGASLLCGPTGTGKTYTIIAVVTALATCGLRVMCTAMSDSAVDRMMEIFEQKKPLTLSQYAGHRYSGSSITKAELQRISVIFVVNRMSHDKALRDFRPEILFSDEATQALPSEALIPMAANLQSLKYVSLCGDPVLMKPKLNSLACNEAARLAEFSILERYVAHGGLGYEVYRIDSQHRMHEKIAKFVGKLIYDGKAMVPAAVCQNLGVDDIVHKELKPLEEKGLINLQNRVLGIDVSGDAVESVQAENSTSYLNETEASVAIDFAVYFIAAGIPPSEILIITNYAAQRDHIRQLLEEYDESECHNIRVLTSGQAQGQEADIVVISEVMNKRGEPNAVKFIADKERLAVSLTRARRWMFILGNFRGWIGAIRSNEGLLGMSKDFQLFCSLVRYVCRKQKAIVHYQTMNDAFNGMDVEYYNYGYI